MVLLSLSVRMSAGPPLTAPGEEPPDDATFDALLLEQIEQLDQLGEIPDADLAELLAEPTPRIRSWDYSASVRLAAGHNDNVVLSATHPEPSGFWLTGIDAFLFRMPVDGREFSLMFMGDDVRYFSSPSADKDQLFLTVAQIGQRTENGFESGFELQHVYQDQILDASATEFELFAVRAQGHGLTGAPRFAANLAPGLRLRLDLPATRQWYRSPLDSFWEAGPRMELERSLADGSGKLSAGFAALWRPYDSRPQTSLDGFQAPGTNLRYQRNRVHAGWQQRWDAARRWQTSCKLAYDRNTDNGSGYFDYDRYHAAVQLAFRTDQWEARLRGTASYYAYDNQPASLEDPAMRRKTGLAVEVHLARSLSRRVRLYADYAREESLANQPLEEYSVNKVLAGIEVEF